MKHYVTDRFVVQRCWINRRKSRNGRKWYDVDIKGERTGLQKTVLWHRPVTVGQVYSSYEAVE